MGPWALPGPPGVRMTTRRAVLAHPSRRRIYEHLLRLPGDHFRGIVRALRLSEGTARHHLAVLLRARLVAKEEADGRCRYYPRGGSRTSQRIGIYRDHWKYRGLGFRVLLSVRNLREARPCTVARALGISRQLASYHLARLAEKGEIRIADGVYRPR